MEDIIQVGESYYCKETVNYANIVTYLKGKTYICQVKGCLTDENGDRNHSWKLPKTSQRFNKHFCDLVEMRNTKINEILEINLDVI